MIYLIKSGLVNHVSIETIRDFESEILKTTSWRSKEFFCYKCGKIFAQIGIMQKLAGLFRTDDIYVSILMDINSFYERTFPYFLLKAGKKVLYLFDAWEPLIPKISDIIRRHNIEIVFVTARQSAELLMQTLPRREVRWLPEGVLLSKCKPADYKAKTIDIMHFGRRYDSYHYEIVNYCKEKGISYFYEKNKGEIIFKSMEVFYQKLGESKISICVPSSVTSPGRSGSVTTLTQRYLQSMGSKCLLLGTAPQELIDLYGYNPVIEIDMRNAREQITAILDNYESYIPLIEKNFSVTNAHHQWKHRAAELKKVVYSI